MTEAASGPPDQGVLVALALNSPSKARVWLTGVPPLDMPAELDRVERAVGAPARGGGPREVAVELYVPTGPKIDTALLVASFSPDRDGSELRVRVATAAEDGAPVEWALAASNVETVCAGLPAQCADGVANTAVEEGLRLGLGAGLISFRQAAHGRVGSSPRVFARCAKLVVRLLAAPRSCLTPENLVSILRGTWALDVEKEPRHTLNEATASFRVFHRDVDPAEVSALLGLEPTFGTKAGDERASTSKRGKRTVHGSVQEGGWVLASGCSRALTLEEHLHVLLDRLEPCSKAVAVLRGRGYRVDFYCGYFQRAGQGGPSFSPTLLARLSRMEVPLGVDIFP